MHSAEPKYSATGCDIRVESRTALCTPQATCFLGSCADSPEQYLLKAPRDYQQVKEELLQPAVARHLVDAQPRQPMCLAKAARERAANIIEVLVMQTTVQANICFARRRYWASISACDLVRFGLREQFIRGTVLNKP